MAAILLDVDGVLHVSGEPIPGAVEALARLRADGHRLRFVTNNSTRTTSALADELRALGIELDADELQTPTTAAAQQLGGRRVYALVMPSIVPDLEGVELVGEGAHAVLVGGCDETTESNQVFSHMNLARAFSEIRAGADLYAMHKNPWWQTSRGPMLDGGAYVAALEYATGVEATVIGKPAASAFAAALSALDAEPELTWMVTDDLEQDVRGAQLFGMKTLLLRTGKFRPDVARALVRHPRRGAQLDRARPGLDRTLPVTRVGVDLIEIERVRRSLERYQGFRDRCFTPAEQAYCDSRKNPAESYAGRFAGKEAVGKALGFGVARAFAWKDIEIAGRPKPSVRLSGRVAAWAERVGAGAIDLSMTHSRELASAVAVVTDA